MSLYPEIQKKAQKELDRVVGPSRLPDFDDYDNLIYVRAIMLESLRWMPVVPMGVPHKVTRDDEYRGFFIQQGTIIIAVSASKSRCHFVADIPSIEPVVIRCLFHHASMYS